MRFDDLRSPPIAIDPDRYNSADERSRSIAGLHLSSFYNTCVDRRSGGPRSTRSTPLDRSSTRSNAHRRATSPAHQKTLWDIVPHEINYETVGFIRPDGLEG